MITFKRIEVKRENRTVKNTDFNYEYKLDYVARYDGEKLTSISKHETKFYNTSKGITGGNYINPIVKSGEEFDRARLKVELFAEIFNYQSTTTTIGG